MNETRPFVLCRVITMKLLLLYGVCVSQYILPVGEAIQASRLVNQSALRPDYNTYIFIYNIILFFLLRLIIIIIIKVYIIRLLAIRFIYY